MYFDYFLKKLYTFFWWIISTTVFFIRSKELKENLILIRNRMIQIVAVKNPGKMEGPVIVSNYGWLSDGLVDLLFQSGFEPSAEHFCSLSVAVFVVGNELLAFLEPFLQGRKILENVRIKLAFDERRKVGHEDEVSQRNGLSSREKSVAAKTIKIICNLLTLKIGL